MDRCSRCAEQAVFIMLRLEDNSTLLPPRISRRLFGLASGMVISLPGLAHAFEAKVSDLEGAVVLQNEELCVGILPASGGAVGFVAPTQDAPNRLNRYDRGRYLQQSYYGDEDGSKWNDTPWRYNPVQGGDWRGGTPRLAEWHSTDQEVRCTVCARPSTPWRDDCRRGSGWGVGSPGRRARGSGRPLPLT
jgi:hypothetical protein